ncbi:alpha/beta fold hydrolase [Streptomyces sp. NPDC006984]|uniref:alpha/beta fold hydrolase n=1 Tax=Streptomyces sp. NPDC006984 TaxID=3155463 RepID=UPI0033EF194C
MTTDDGVRLHYLEAGSGPDMLLVPGWSQTAAQWRHQIDHFARTHHVVAVDHRGHGDSDRPDHGYRIARLANDLHQLVHGLDLEGIVLVAHSIRT